MDNESKATIYCRTLITFIATLHLALSPLLHLSYGYAPVIFACFTTILVPHFLLTFRARQLEKKVDLAINSRILNCLTRDRYITWNEVHFSFDVILASINIFACYTNLAIRAREGGHWVYYLVPTGLSFLVFVLFTLDACFTFQSIKRNPRPRINHKPRKKLDRFMNFLAERLIVVQFPILILTIAWHYLSIDQEDYDTVGMGIVAANFIQYPLIFMITVFFHARIVRWFQSYLGKIGLHVYGVQYTILLIITGLGLSSFVLNTELNIKFHGNYNGYFYLITPYLTSLVSITQAFALAGHEAWKDFNATYQNNNSNAPIECNAVEVQMNYLPQDQTNQNQTPEIFSTDGHGQIVNESQEYLANDFQNITSGS
uniref:Gustatory receptor n=1 Tax=Acrobeloides nanus TaxID=290746 RepID=A0A914DAZ7_9BILA